MERDIPGRNLCQEAGCEDACCKGNYLLMSPEDYDKWIARANPETIHAISLEEWLEERVKVLPYSSPVIILRSGVSVEGEKTDLVAVDGSCPNLDPNKGGCVIYENRPKSCQKLEVGSELCARARAKLRLPPINPIIRPE